MAGESARLSAALPIAPRTRNALLIGLLFVILILLALITLPSLTNTRTETLRTQLNDTVVAFDETLTETENDLQQMQAAVRGYILTQTPAFLEQYRSAQDGLPARLQDLTELGPRVDPAMEVQVAELVEVIMRWQRESGDRHIALVQQGRAAEAIRQVSSGNGQAIFDSFRSRITDLQDQTQATNVSLLEQINRARTLQIVLTSGLGALGLLAGGFVIFGFRRMQILMRDLQVERERTSNLAHQAHIERQRLEAVFDHSPEGIIFAEMPDGTIVLANQAAYTFLGATPPKANLRTHPLTQRIYRPGGEPVAPADLPFVRSLERGEACQGVELIIEQPDGQRVPMLVTSVPLRAEDGILRGVIAVFQDLRRLREVERLKSDFVALVSHELRTPLTAIQGCAQTLLNNSSDADRERTREFVQIIAEQGERLQELIDNLLSLSQVEASALRLRRELVQPQQLIQRVLRQLRERLSDRRIQADIPPGLPVVSADERRIEQVLVNLLDNAHKFSPSGGIVTLSATVAANIVTICVRDQGPGIPASERERVFERFYQLEQPMTRNVGGTGLGLAICKALIEAHSGRIWIEDNSSGGTSVCFTLPAVPAAQVNSVVNGTNVLVQAQADTMHVLVVDDDPALRRLLEGGLHDAGYSVQSVVEPQAAIESVTQRPPDIILLDVMLPGIDCFALCKQLREWTSVPIIMLTARAAEKDVVLGLQLGADDYVTKPFRMNELVARVEAVLRRVQPEAIPGKPAFIQVGDLAIDLAQRQITLDSKGIELTPTEYRLLAHLARHAGQVLTHEQLLREVWGEEYSGENHYLWVHIAHLRQKIEADSKQPRYILTERGVGYRLAKD